MAGRKGQGEPRSLDTKLSSAPTHLMPCPTPQPTSMTLPGWKGKTGSRSSFSHTPAFRLLYTVLLTSPNILKRGLKCRHRLLLSVPRFSAKLGGDRWEGLRPPRPAVAPSD